MTMQKKNILKIGLFVVLILTAFFSVYSIWNYGSKNSSTENVFSERSSFSGHMNQSPQSPNQGTGRQFQNPSNRTPQGGSPSFNQNRGMGQGNMNFRGNFANDGKKYVPQIIIYSILFFGFFIFVYYYQVQNKFKISPDMGKITILTLLGIGLLLRIIATTLVGGHPFDMNTFKSWATSAANNLFQVYSGGRSSDYPPLYIYVLYIIGTISNISFMKPYYTILLRLPSIFADIATSYLIYKLAKKYLSQEMSIILSAFYIFNPAVFINSTFWGQVDSFFTLFVISAVLLLSENKIGLSAILFTAAVLMKPQGIIFLPVLFFELVRQESLKSFLKAVALALGTAVIIVLPFALNKGPMWIFNLYLNTVGEYKYASVNAFNFYSLLGANYQNDSTTLFVYSYHTWGTAAIVLITLFSWFVYSKARNKMFAPAAALCLIAGVFTFSTRMHERYLFPAVALAILAFIYLKDRRFLFLAGGFSLTVYINTYYVLYNTGIGANSINFDPILMLTSLMNVFLFCCLVKVLLDSALNKKISIIKDSTADTLPQNN